MIFCTRRCVGIAIGEHLTHIVELHKKKTHVHIRLTAVVKTMTATTPALDALQHCLSRQAVISIPESYIRKKTFAIKDQLSSLQIERDLQNNLHRYFPQHKAGDLFDFHRTNDDTLQVIVSKRAKINAIVQHIEKRHLQVRHIRIATSHLALSPKPEKLTADFFNAYALSLQGIS